MENTGTAKLFLDQHRLMKEKRSEKTLLGHPQRTTSGIAIKVDLVLKAFT